MLPLETTSNLKLHVDGKPFATLPPRSFLDKRASGSSFHVEVLEDGKLIKSGVLHLDSDL